MAKFGSFSLFTSRHCCEPLAISVCVSILNVQRPRRSGYLAPERFIYDSPYGCAGFRHEEKEAIALRELPGAGAGNEMNGRPTKPVWKHVGAWALSGGVSSSSQRVTRVERLLILAWPGFSRRGARAFCVTAHRTIHSAT